MEPVLPAVRRALDNARRSQQVGDWAGAAAIYTHLAEEAYLRGRIRAGVQMDMEAARAYLEAQDYPAMQEQLVRALRSLLTQELPVQPVLPLIERVSVTLESGGAGAAAQSLHAAVEAELHVYSLSLATATPAQSPPHSVLPAQCPACTAPLHPAEVTWLEFGRAQCAYCGAMVLPV
jgi:hypothetical protein